MHQIFKEKAAFNLSMPTIPGSAKKEQQIIWYKPVLGILSHY